MTPADREKVVAALHEKLVAFLSPHGIEVAHAPGTGGTVAEFTFRVPDPAPGKPGRTSELLIHLDAAEARTCHTNPQHLDRLPVVWARILADWVPNLFDGAVMPTAEAPDWRPGEAIPEDFGPV